MYGLAIGDALGAAVEFRQPGEFEPVTGYRGGGPHGIAAGEWTDDTSMALALADSLASGFDEKDQLTKYLDWFQNGKYSVNGMCFDIGNTTRHALYDFEAKGTLLASDDEACSGNGSIMRLAPVAIWFRSNNGPFDGSHDELVDYLERSSATTHGSKTCKSACKYLGLILNALLMGFDLRQVFTKQFFLDDLELASHIDKIRNDSFKSGNVKGSGWVVESLEAAMWAVWSTDNFKDAVLAAVNLGDDSDTTGAVAGQIAGAYYGYSGIPADLIEGLAKKEMIDQYLEPLLLRVREDEELKKMRKDFPMFNDEQLEEMRQTAEGFACC